MQESSGQGRDIDRTGSPEARGFLALEEARVEMEIKDDAI